jgi:flavin reductase (DIM6/NTAB) family NADH-FMN oxidoreductase RutF
LRFEVGSELVLSNYWNKTLNIHNPVTLVGAQVEGKPNFVVLDWVSRINFKPLLIGIGVEVP